MAGDGVGNVPAGDGQTPTGFLVAAAAIATLWGGYMASEGDYLWTGACLFLAACCVGAAHSVNR